jgi:hypothetical protein
MFPFKNALRMTMFARGPRRFQRCGENNNLDEMGARIDRPLPPLSAPFTPTLDQSLPQCGRPNLGPDKLCSLGGPLLAPSRPPSLCHGHCPGTTSWRYRLTLNFDTVAGGCGGSGGRPRRGRSGRRVVSRLDLRRDRYVDQASG